MDQRTELIKTIDEYTDDVSARDLHKADFSERFADVLLADGWIRPPCEVGDKLYYIAYRSNDGKTEKYIKEETVEMISIDSRSIYAHIPRALLIDLADLGKTVFLTREEAEQALKGGEE